MRPLLFYSFALLLITVSCKKENTDYFVFGRLLYIDTNLPVAGEQIQLWQEYSGGFASTSFGEKLEKKLETVLTDAQGYFYFTGAGYANKTGPISPASLRLTSGQEWKFQTLGITKKAKKNGYENYVQDTGDLYKE